MYSLVLKIAHNTRIKDTIAIARGLYRVTQGALPQGSANKVRLKSWFDQQQPSNNISANKTQQQNKNPSQQRIKQIIKQEQNKQINKVKIEDQDQDSISIKQTHIKNDQNKVNNQKLTNQPQKQNLTKQQIVSNIIQQNKTQKQQDIQKDKEKIQKIQKKQQQQKNKQYLKQFKIKQIKNNNQITPPLVSTIPSSRLSRIFQFGKLGVSLASASIFSKGKDQSHYQELAEKVSNQLCKMRGAPLKLAQMLSIQQDNLIPAPIRKAFQKARQSAHVIPKQQVELMLQKNLGSNWNKRFKQFQFTPVASASIGQVHKAILPNDQQVAIKIQYNQVKESIESDIQNLVLLLRLPGVFPKGMYVERILTNTKAQLMQECDYLLEKFYQEKYDFYLKKSFGDQAKLFKVPKIYPQFTTTQILTSQFITGIKMKDLQQQGYSQELRDQIGRRIMKLTFKQLFQMGIMQSDPNPSNFTYNHIKDELNLYDFGATHIYKRQFLQNYYKIIEGSVKKDQKKIWQASIATGFVTGQQNMAMKNGHIQSIMITGQPLRFQGKYDFGSQQITNRIYKTIPLMLKNRLRPPPEQVYSLHRKLSGSYLACIRLKAKVDCSKIFKQIKFQTLANNQKYIPPSESPTNLQD